MQVAIKYGWIAHEPVLDSHGKLTSGGSGLAIVERLLHCFPAAVLVGTQRRSGEVEQVLLTDLDVDNTLLINLDIIDSVGAFQVIHKFGNEPHIMNLQWEPPTKYHHRVNFAAMGLSYALFPTFCAGRRTAESVLEIMRKWTPATINSQAHIAWADLGVYPEKVRPRAERTPPVVLYPAIALSERKNPQEFLRITEATQRLTPLTVTARLSHPNLTSNIAMDMSRRKWMKLAPLTRPGDDFWDVLASATAFLACATEESSGLGYLEALMAGCVGVFADRPWSRELLPPGYPFRYRSESEGIEMLQRALTQPQVCRDEVDKAIGCPLGDWVRTHYRPDTFDEILVSTLRSWFPLL